MFVKTYEPSSYVKYLFEVKGRITLDDFDEAQYKRLYSGYTGEKQFYESIKNCGSTKLWDLRLDYHGEVQYDFLVIHDGYLFHFDIKNFSGHYSFIDNNFVSEQNYVIKDPISQFNGAHIKLKQFCMKHNLDYKILSYVVFINPDFIVTGFNGHSHILFHGELCLCPPYTTTINPVHSLYVADFTIVRHTYSLHSFSFLPLKYIPFHCKVVRSTK
ncbi:NERD domain-containing protein [Macrococcoides canis]|uniref:nuclease-related domain-containing protein n=1 Tax=Macrococcoides canis TaxID=1855823 RepID=UPI001F2FEFB5|nr:nuclease-related domain-containing protein [Macrococcus canis]UJS28140.1 NERD domain-containing protein [Macrococcus canis]